jgi:uncharacterized coiled-coil protein SlyX
MKRESTTMKAARMAPRIAVFLAGIAAGTLTLARRKGALADPEDLARLRQAAAELEARVAQHESVTAERFAKIESRLDEQAARLAEVPSTTQIVSAMEQLLIRTMSSLEDRISTQAKSIEALKSTVAQTDSVLERILESLDTLQTEPEARQTEEELLELTR